VTTQSQIVEVPIVLQITGSEDSFLSAIPEPSRPGAFRATTIPVRKNARAMGFSCATRTSPTRTAALVAPSNDVLQF
jgi:hypothetical protein